MSGSKVRERVARNRSVAERFYEGYHLSVERGELVGAFDPDDFAEEWVFCSPFLGGELPQQRAPHLAMGATMNHATISQRIPDYRMDHLLAFPTEHGCAWRWCVNGTGIDGNPYEFWEQIFTWADDEGRITRFEFYDDWHGFPQSLAFSYDTSLDTTTRMESYGRAPWASPGAFDNHPPAHEDEPTPSTERARANLALADRLWGFLDPQAEDRQDLDADVFAEGWTFFSPWTGERQPSFESLGVFVRGAYERVSQRLPDLRADTFGVWPADAGWAWRRRLAGTSADGSAYECWEQGFASTDAGRIVRLELYYDWQAFPQMLGVALGLSLEDLWDADRVAGVLLTATG